MAKRRILYVTLLVTALLYGCSLLPSAGDQGAPAASPPTMTQRSLSRTPVSRPRATPRPTRAKATAQPTRTSRPTAQPTLQPPATASPTAVAARPQAQPIAGFDAVTPEQLPREARDTLAL